MQKQGSWNKRFLGRNIRNGIVKQFRFLIVFLFVRSLKIVTVLMFPVVRMEEGRLWVVRGEEGSGNFEWVGKKSSRDF